MAGFIFLPWVSVISISYHDSSDWPALPTMGGRIRVGNYNAADEDKDTDIVCLVAYQTELQESAFDRLYAVRVCTF